jgi:hypothetical protein
LTVLDETPVALAVLPAAPAPAAVEPVDPVEPADPVEAADPVDPAVVALELEDLCELPQPDAIRPTTPAATTKAPHLRRALLVSIAYPSPGWSGRAAQTSMSG